MLCDKADADDHHRHRQQFLRFLPPTPSPKQHICRYYIAHLDNQPLSAIHFAQACDSVCISGYKQEWQNEQNLVYQACAKVFAKCNKQLKGLKIEIDAEAIPDAFFFQTL